MLPNSMLPKNEGAITIYHVLLRHLSRMCFADFADKGYFSEPLQKILKPILKLLPFIGYFLSVPHVFS